MGWWLLMILIIVIIVIYLIYLAKNKFISYIKGLNCPTTEDLNRCLENSQSYSLDSISKPAQKSIKYNPESLSTEDINSIEERRYFRDQPENTNKFFMEEQCRTIMEEIFPNHKFNKVRPEWLKNPLTGRRMELDGYNAEYKLAFEYNGYQHYVFPNKYHKTKEEFIRQKERDIMKLEICNQVGVYLLTIPYNVPLHHLRSFIIRHLPVKFL